MDKALHCATKYVGEVFLSISVLFFGVSLVVMRYAMFYSLGPHSFNAGRFVVSALCLVLLKFMCDTYLPTEPSSPAKPANIGSMWKTSTLVWGACLGILNFIASAAQQVGLATVNASRAGFIVGMYVVFVPVTEQLIPALNAKPSRRAWIAAILSMFGLYLMSGCFDKGSCVGEGVGHGEIHLVLSMVFWVISIISCGIASKLADPISLTTINFQVAALLSVASALIMEPHVWKDPRGAIQKEWAVLVGVGLLQAIGFVLCTIGQRFCSPSTSAVIMSLDTVVCAVVSVICLGERMDVDELLGSAVMLIATGIALVPARCRGGSISRTGESDGDMHTMTIDTTEEGTAVATSSTLVPMPLAATSPGLKPTSRSSYSLFGSNNIHRFSSNTLGESINSVLGNGYFHEEEIFNTDLEVEMSVSFLSNKSNSNQSK